ncbi:hypothetical protein [Flavobacterium sp. 316]|uniref:hypothetical protein n=1 Tax=Flavobacterium sp. 316 TaxID=1603293 RepID=UPI000B176259|nr:hypothetical protein [Flavobacterium sp. 316]
MKKMNKIIITILITAFCLLKINAQNTIPYLVNLETEKSIYKEILNKPKEDIAFLIENVSDKRFKIHLISFKDKEIQLTNRKLFINDEFYPIIFYTDYLFYTQLKDNKPLVSFEESKNVYKDISIPTIEEREKNNHLYGLKRKSIIVDNSIYWIIDDKGKLVETNSILKTD